MQPDAPASRTLESLPPRPPTPPRDSQQGTNRPSLFSRIFSKSLGAQTPPNLSPGSAAAAASSPSERANRRVAWSASTDYRDHEEPPKNSNAINPKLRLIPSSADRQQPQKSILKQNSGDAVNRHIDFHIQPNAHTPETFAMMLESVTKQLAGDDRLSRIDAYMSLSDVLKASDIIPDEEALRNKMGLLAQFMRRDIVAQTAEGEVDKVLVNNALTLLASLLWKNEQFSQEFAVFVLEHTITSFERAAVPKDVVKHLMFIIGQQNFSPKIVTTDRATRLLHSTYLIQEKYNGKSIALGRLNVYKKLLQQAKGMMIAPTNTLWLKHVFEDMLNPVKNVRGPAVAFGFEAALQLGTEKQGSRAFSDLFESPYDEASKYADYYHGRLLRMLQSKGENASLEKASVPRIWSIMIIFLRYKPAQLDKWEFWPSYLHVLQKCFNSSDPEVKAQANLAWNRLVFALQPDDNAEKRRLNRQLLQPFLGQLHAKRKSTGKNSKEAFQITVSSACNLLYYALRPSASHISLDFLWDLYVPPLIQQLSDTDSNDESQNAGGASCEGSNQAIAILHALLNPAPRAKQPWRVDRAMSDERMRFDELSPVDPKWVRSNSPRILAALQPLLKRRFKDLSADQSRLKDLWKGYLLSIAAAAAKEVITSHETMACIAHIYTMAHAFWQQRPCHDAITQEGQSTAFLDGFVHLLTEMVKVLGMLPFSEKRLSVEDLNPFAVVATPSTGSRKVPKAAKTAVQCLLSLLVAPGPDIEANFAVKGAFRRLLLPFYEFRAKNKTTVEFLQELFHTLPTIESAAEVNRGAVEAVWCVLAKFMYDTLEYSYSKPSSGGSSNSTPNSQLLGVTFRDKIRVLEYGLVYISYGGVEEWQSLYSQTSYSISQEVGIGGRGLAVIEPLAHSLVDLYRPEEARSFVTLFSAVIKDAQYPATAQSLEAARRRLWGVSSTSTRQSIDPYKQLYRAMNFYLEKSYELEGASQAVADMMEHSGTFIRQCPHALHEGLLQTLSNSVAIWLRDPEDVTSTADSDSLKASINDLWDDIQDSIDTRPGHNDLGKLKTILAAALESRHKYIVSRAIELWNQRFGVLENLEYPDEVAKALARLRSSANLLLPNFPDIPDGEAPPATINFLESDDSDPMEYTGGPRYRSVTPSNLGSSPVKVSSPAITLGIPRSVMSSTINHQHLELPKPSKRKPAKQDTPLRLRHDNSQIKFAAIEHAPEPADAESQVLTDHQREIKERQEEENRAMFADLRSSPKPKAKKSEKKRLSLTSDRPVRQATEQDQPATPSVTSAARTLDDWVTSSPTPQNRKQKHVAVEDDIAEVVEQAPADFPSSPPKARSSSPPPGPQTCTPSPKAKSAAADIAMEVAHPKLIEVPPLHPPGPSNVDSPPSFANLVDHLAAESVTHSSPAAASASLSQLTKTTSKRRRSPAKLSPCTIPAEDDEDEIMEEAPAVALVTPSGVVFDDPPSPAPAQAETATSAPPSTKSKKRGRPKTSKSGRKSTEHQAELATIASQPVPPVEDDRRRSSSLSELDESMVKSLEQHHVPYVSLKPNADFSPEQYEKVEVFSSPQREADTEQPKKETRILPPTKATGKPKTARKSDVKSTSKSATVKTRAADKRQSMTPTVETPVPTPQRASSRLRHVEPEVVDLEKADPSLSRSGGRLSRSERQKAFAESLKKTPASKLNDVEIVEEAPVSSEAPKKSHKKKEKVAEAPVREAPAANETPKRSSHSKRATEPEKEVASTPVMETWLRKETPIPVPCRKRKPSDQVDHEHQPVGPPGQIAVLEATEKSSRDRKRRKKDEKKLQAQVVEDSQQNEQMEVEHEGINVPPLLAVPEKLHRSEKENDTSSETYKIAKSGSATGSQTSKVSVSVGGAQRKKKSKSGKNGKGLSAADRSVVESSQAEGDSKPIGMEEGFNNMIDTLMAEFEQVPPESQRSTRKTPISKKAKHGTELRAADRIVVESSQREDDERRELMKENLDLVMGGVESEAVSQKGDAEDDAISIVSSHLEVSQTEETTTVKYFNRSGNLQREVTKWKSPEPAQTPAAKDSDTDIAEAEVEAQLRSSIVSNNQLEPSTPPRAMSTSSSQKSSTPQQEQDVIPSSPPPGGQQRTVQTSSEYISSSLPSDAVEPGKSSSKPSSGEQSFTSSLPQRARQSVEEADHRRFAESVRDQPRTQQPALEGAQRQPKVTSSSAASASWKEEELSYENIAAVFAQGIEMLNRCNSGIRRHHVAKMEEMVFDIKGAMYNAEKRSREQMTEEERIMEFGRFD